MPDQGQRIRIPGRNVAEVHVHCAAADHAQILDLVFMQPEVLKVGAARPEELLGHLLTAVFHRAAADGATQAALSGDDHPRPGSPWGGATAGHHGDQHCVLAAGQGVAQGGK